jgi:hypothetical protein
MDALITSWYSNVVRRRLHFLSFNGSDITECLRVIIKSGVRMQIGIKAIKWNRKPSGISKRYFSIRCSYGAFYLIIKWTLSVLRRRNYILLGPIYTWGRVFQVFNQSEKAGNSPWLQDLNCVFFIVRHLPYIYGTAFYVSWYNASKITISVKDFHSELNTCTIRFFHFFLFTEHRTLCYEYEIYTLIHSYKKFSLFIIEPSSSIVFHRILNGDMFQVLSPRLIL